MSPAIAEIGEEIWKEPVDRILSRLAATAAGLNSAKVAAENLRTQRDRRFGCSFFPASATRW